MKNKRIAAFLCVGVLACASVLAACEAEEVQINTNDMQAIFDNIEADEYRNMVKNINNHIYVITDPKTGVQYIVYREKIGYAGIGGITPRLNPDGTLMVVETSDEASTNLS